MSVLVGHAAVHHPDAVGAAIALLDALEEVTQCGSVRGVARQDLVLKGKPSGVTIKALPAGNRRACRGCSRIGADRSRGARHQSRSRC